MTTPTIFGGVQPTWTSQQTQKTLKNRIISYQYGNGYMQILPDGPNPTSESWTLQWDNLNVTQATALEAWLVVVPPWIAWAGDGYILSTTIQYRQSNDGWQKTFVDAAVLAYTLAIEQCY